MYDKVHFCTFCGAQLSGNFHRHLTNVHSDEETVRDILMLPKRSLERKVKLQQLVNEGNFKHNIIVMREGKGEIVVGRRCTSKAASDYTACGFCKKFQLKTSLWRHTKSCMARKEYFDKTEKSKRIVAVERGRSLVINAVFSDTPENDLVSELLQHM